MTGSHGLTGSLYGPVDTALHRVAAKVKIVCLVLFLIAVVATPQRVVVAFFIYAIMVGLSATCARIPPRVLGRRLLIEIPFVLFAFMLPFIGREPSREVLGFAISIPGLWAAWAILAKATLGAAAVVVLAWSTPVAEIITALDQLRFPRILTAIAGFMVRYLEVVSGELTRLQVARISRGDDPRWFWQARALASTLGTLFVRSFERGERVHQAMLARGFNGSIPPQSRSSIPSRWFPAMLIPIMAAFVAGAANLL